MSTTEQPTRAASVSLKVPQELRDQTAHLAELQNRSSEAVMLDAIEKYVSHQLWRREIWRDADEAYREYKETGLHLTNEEVIEWLGRRAKGEDVELPECHT